jgi:hypothetical protein
MPKAIQIETQAKQKSLTLLHRQRATETAPAAGRTRSLIRMSPLQDRTQNQYDALVNKYNNLVALGKRHTQQGH